MGKPSPGSMRRHRDHRRLGASRQRRGRPLRASWRRRSVPRPSRRTLPAGAGAGAHPQSAVATVALRLREVNIGALAIMIRPSPSSSCPALAASGLDLPHARRPRRPAERRLLETLTRPRARPRGARRRGGERGRAHRPLPRLGAGAGGTGALRARGGERGARARRPADPRPLPRRGGAPHAHPHRRRPRGGGDPDRLPRPPAERRRASSPSSTTRPASSPTWARRSPPTSTRPRRPARAPTPVDEVEALFEARENRFEEIEAAATEPARRLPAEPGPRREAAHELAAAGSARRSTR